MLKMLLLTCSGLNSNYFPPAGSVPGYWTGPNKFETVIVVVGEPPESLVYLGMRMPLTKFRPNLFSFNYVSQGDLQFSGTFDAGSKKIVLSSQDKLVADVMIGSVLLECR